MFLNVHNLSRVALLIDLKRDASDVSTLAEFNSSGLQNQGSKIYQVDLASRRSIEALVPQAEADGHRITILLNCAGVIIRHSCTDFPSEDWDKVMLF